jgi:hypothetical protein
MYLETMHRLQVKDYIYNKRSKCPLEDSLHPLKFFITDRYTAQRCQHSCKYSNRQPQDYGVVTLHCVRFEIFMAVTTKNGVFWDVMPCGSCFYSVTSQKIPFFLFTVNSSCIKCSSRLKTNPDWNVACVETMQWVLLYPSVMIGVTVDFSHNTVKYARAPLCMYHIHAQTASGTPSTSFGKWCKMRSLLWLPEMWAYQSLIKLITTERIMALFLQP